MAGIRTTPTDVTPNFWAEDFTQTVNTLLANDAGIVQMLFGNANMLISGCALSAAVGMSVNVAAGQATANGVILPISAGTVTLAASNTQPRYDVIYGLIGTTTGSNITSGQTTVADSATLGVTTGTAGATPAIPALPSANYVQLGTVYVPANVVSSAGCTLNSQVTSPNAQGPLKTLVDLITHIAANFATATVHGFQATSPGGTGVNQIPITDALGGVGKANSMGPNALGAAASIDPNTRSSGASNGLILFSSNGPTGVGGAFLEYYPPTAGNIANTLGITSTTSLPLDELGLGAKEVSFRANPYGTRVIAIRTDGVAGDPGVPGIRAGDVGLVSLYLNPTAGGNVYLAWDVAGTVHIGSVLNLQNPGTTTTAPAAGGAGALPATPTGYVTVNIGGVPRKIAYY